MGSETDLVNDRRRSSQKELWRWWKEGRVMGNKRKVCLGNPFCLSFDKAQQSQITRATPPQLCSCIVCCSPGATWTWGCPPQVGFQDHRRRTSSCPWDLPGHIEPGSHCLHWPQSLLCPCLSLFRISSVRILVKLVVRASPPLSVPQIPHLQNRGNKTVYLKELLKG